MNNEILMDKQVDEVIGSSGGIEIIPSYMGDIQNLLDELMNMLIHIK